MLVFLNCYFKGDLVYYFNSTPQRYAGFSNRASFSLTFFKNNRIFNFCSVLTFVFQGFSHSKRKLSAIVCPERWSRFSSQRTRANSMSRAKVNVCENRGPNVKLASEILTIGFSIFIPLVIPFVLSRDDKRGIVSFRFENPLGANRRFEAPKLTTSEEQTVDLLRSKPSICKLEVVDLAK